MASNGIQESDIILDGTFKELKTNSFKGWYIGDDLGDGKRSITIEDWRSRDRKSFQEGIDITDPAQKAELEAVRQRYEKEKLDLQILKKKLSKEWLEEFKAENWKTPSKYLTNKKITETFGAVIKESTVETTDLIIPMYDKDGELWNYQTIQDSGFKSFVPGALVDGLYFQLKSEKETPDEILICEGFATACSVKMAMPSCVVVCAFFADNLQAVAESYRVKCPLSKILICGDDDWKKDENAGLMKAESAARATASGYVLPVFAKIRGREWTDFNDLHQHYSLEVVSTQIKKALDELKPPTPMWSQAFMDANTQEAKTTKQSTKAKEANLKRADSLNTIDPYINGVQPMEMRLSKTGQPIMPSEFTVADQLYKYYEGRTVYSEGSIFIYDQTHWKEVDEFNESRILVQLQVLYNGMATNSKLKATYEQFTYLIPKAPRNLFLANPYIVNFKNGTLHVEQSKGKWGFVFSPQSKDNYCTHVIPIDYDPTRAVRNHEFESMLDRIFSKSMDKEDKIKAIRQMYGACVAPIFPHLFMLYGSGGSGKSSLIIPAQRLVHQDNWSSVEPHEFKGFLMESMAGKLVNIVLDINTQEPIEDNHIKKIEDRVPVRIDRKFKNALLAPLPAVHIFGGNDIPATYEKGSGAHKRRWTFLGVEGFQAVGNYSKNFANEAFDQCPVGVLNFALDGLLEVLEANGHYHVPESGVKKMDDWQKAHDRVALFFHEISEGEDFGLRLEKDAKTERTYIWATFVAWHKNSYNAVPKQGKHKFFAEVERLGGINRGIFQDAKIALVKIEGVWKFSGLRKTDTIPAWGAASYGSGQN